jgi:hypothetical protein
VIGSLREVHPLEQSLTHQKERNMSNEAERDPKQQHQQGKHEPAGPVNTSDTKTNPSPGSQGQGRHAGDISKKDPSRDSGSQHGQEKPDDQKRRAS